MSNRFAIFFSVGSILISILALIFSFADIETNKLDFSANSFLSVIGTVITTLGFVFGMYFALLAVKAYGDIKKIEEQAETINKHVETINKHAETINEHNTNVDNQAQAIQQHFENIEIQAEKIKTQTSEVEANNNSIKQIFEQIKAMDQNAKDTKISIDKEVKVIESLAHQAIEYNSSINSILNLHQDNHMMTIDYQMELNSLQRNSLDSKNPENQLLLNLLGNYWTHLTRMRAKTSYFFPQLEITKRKQFMIELGGLGDEEDLPYLKRIIDSESEPNDFKEIVKITIKNIEDRIKSKSNKD